MKLKKSVLKLKIFLRTFSIFVCVDVLRNVYEVQASFVVGRLKKKDSSYALSFLLKSCTYIIFQSPQRNKPCKNWVG